jgi:hypothetical protein
MALQIKTEQSALEANGELNLTGTVAIGFFGIQTSTFQGETYFDLVIPYARSVTLTATNTDNFDLKSVINQPDAFIKLEITSSVNRELLQGGNVTIKLVQ